jgi:hypothetical protein
MSEPSTLPEGWENMLDAIHTQLQAAIAAVDARAATLPSSADEPASAIRRADLTAFATSAEGLKERVAPTHALAGDADHVLASAEAFLRWRLAEAESLHQRLAAWATRAIG